LLGALPRPQDAGGFFGDQAKALDAFHQFDGVVDGARLATSAVPPSTCSPERKISVLICLAASELREARLRISAATTAKPRQRSTPPVF